MHTALRGEIFKFLPGTVENVAFQVTCVTFSGMGVNGTSVAHNKAVKHHGERFTVRSVNYFVLPSPLGTYLHAPRSPRKPRKNRGLFLLGPFSGMRLGMSRRVNV